jgi:hypothetical protein
MKKRLTQQEKSIISEEDAYVGICLLALADSPVHEIAKAARLSTTTVYNLRHGVRRGTHAMTVRKLGEAAGIRLTYNRKGQPRLRVIGKRERA